MIRPGLCSVTFRELDAERVVELAAEAGLACVEWAGDAHVPPGDTAAAERARSLTESAGLAVASYGSYLRFDGTDEEFAAESEAVLAAARALGAPRIRVWAGRTGSAETPAAERSRIAARIREVAQAAGAHGIDLGLEFHGGTLTDEIGSTLRLLEEIGHDRVLSYWQPHQGMPEGDALQTLRQVLPRTSTIHVFSWWPRHERLPLTDRAALWREVFTVLAAEGSDRDALLEFVPGDDPSVLAREALSLRELIAAGTEDAR
ncbi:sugar phosphate isomerase/epimerase [Brachybacterium faecium DSM 4810]|uniref:Sugar phosphate isomerase/epimerase n=1 Tax=Brachybacterium faecium (strain ATCC 43885 / DSM 4810 / JCM 11609 / LMG 19847 / NBRC 14762 / NCIMB 9860 / 6-10) TaxID=446465 RepID=C7MHZ0_BRAFD|nr:sugar phosphate isomerase/epimerase [Brachybacterium faecium]ACU86657.1 sugar phosphate isomerase/epimerase [Brachybacterium faecium DSM 4810]HJG50546.1 sugar phosphate isomerase/epimerase [Brachybacterium faecium]